MDDRDELTRLRALEVLVMEAAYEFRYREHEEWRPWVRRRDELFASVMHRVSPVRPCPLGSRPDRRWE